MASLRRTLREPATANFRTERSGSESAGHDGVVARRVLHLAEALERLDARLEVPSSRRRDARERRHRRRAASSCEGRARARSLPFGLAVGHALSIGATAASPAAPRRSVGDVAHDRVAAAARQSDDEDRHRVLRDREQLLLRALELRALIRVPRDHVGMEEVLDEDSRSRLGKREPLRPRGGPARIVLGVERPPAVDLLLPAGRQGLGGDFAVSRDRALLASSSCGPGRAGPRATRRFGPPTSTLLPSPWRRRFPHSRPNSPTHSRIGKRRPE